MSSKKPFLHCSILRSKPVVAAIAVLITLICFVYTPLPSQCTPDSEGAFCKAADRAKNTFAYDSSLLSSSPVDDVKTSPQNQALDRWRPTELSNVKSKYAIATFLAGDAKAGDDDPYFINARILAYQLLHAQDTASADTSIPFIVLVTDKVSEEKCERLRKDGAIVVVGEAFTADWMDIKVSTWKDVMTKLSLWELTQFERILLLDSDTIITAPLDGIFDDPAVKTQQTLQIPDATRDDEAPLPDSFNFAGVPEMNRNHSYPPTEENHDFPNINYLNSGFLVFKPDIKMLKYYQSVLSIPNRFKAALPEQNLMNYAHRRGGNMPWTQLNNTWNIHYPTLADLEGGVKSLHDKWWSPENKELTKYMDAWRWRMEGFFEAMDLVQGNA